MFSFKFFQEIIIWSNESCIKLRNRLRGKTENEKLYNDNMVLASELKDESLSVKIVVIH